MLSKDRTQWLLDRRSGIGGSDIAAVLGLSPWRSPLEVYEDKTSEAPPVDIGNEAMKWGTLLETPIAAEWAERAGVKVQRVNSILRLPDKPWALANIDRAVLEPGARARVDKKSGRLLGAEALLEVKTAGAHAAAAWGDEDAPNIPPHYAAQGMWYLAITGLPRVVFAALIGGQRLVERELRADPDTIAMMLDAAEAFWRDHVLARVPPAPRSAADVARLFRRDDGTMRDLSNDVDVQAAIRELAEAQFEIAEWKKREEELKDALKAVIGSASGIAINGRPVVTWKATKDTRHTDWEAVAHAVWTDLVAHNVPESRWEELVAKATTIAPGSRRFIVK